MPENISGSSRLTYLSLAGLGLVFVLLVWNSWMRWPDVLIDFSREIYVPWRISQGDILFRDIISNYGPLPYATIAGLFSLFGESILKLALVNLGFSLVFLLLTHTFVRRAFGLAEAFFAGLVLLVFFFFGHFIYVGNYNWACPYAVAYVHGATYAMAMLLCLQTGLISYSWRPVALAGVFFGIVMLTRMEIVLAAIAAIASYTTLLVLSGTPRSTILSNIGAFCAGALFSILALLLLLSPMMDVSLWFEQLTMPLRFAAKGGMESNIFYKRISGFDNPGLKLLLMGRGWLYVVSAMAAFWSLDRLFLARQNRLLHLLSLIIATVAVLFLRPGLMPIFFHGVLFTPIAFWAAWRALGLFWKKRYEPDTKWRLGSLVMLSAFALGLLGKIILNPGFAHYGFVLGLGGGLVLVLMLLWGPKGLLPRHLRPGRIYFFLMAACLLVDCTWGALASNEILQKKDTPLTSRGETIYGYSTHTGISRSAVFVQSLVDILDKEMEIDDTLVVLPEGAMLNYLLRRKSSVPNINFLYPELTRRGEENILTLLQANPPDFVVLIPKFTAELGVGLFGEAKGHGKSIMTWVHENYDLILREQGTSNWPENMRAIIFRHRMKN